MEYLLSAPFVAQSSTTFYVLVFNWYFLVSAYLSQILQGFFMVYFLGFDLLFTIIDSLMWLAIPTFNFAFLISSASFQTFFVTSDMWLLWTLSFAQLAIILAHWQILQGQFTTTFKIPITLSSVFMTAYNIMNYALQSALFMTYAYEVRNDLGLTGLY